MSGQAHEAATTYVYSAYNLTIASQIELPELLPAKPQAIADVVIDFGSVAWSPETLPRNGGGLLHHVDATTSFYFWNETGPISVLDGREIRIDRAPGTSPSLLRLPILGQLMAIVLLQRGHLVLHGSAVTIESDAVIFVGEKGYGKSTLAAALHARGHGFLSDDVVALSFTQSPEVLAAFPQLKLWPDAISLLENDPALFPQLTVGYDKRQYRVQQGFVEQPRPLTHIYILSDGDEPAIEPLSPIDAFQALLPHTFGNRLGWNDGEARRDSEFRQLSNLVKRAPAFLLQRPRVRMPLATVARMVEEHNPLLAQYSLDSERVRQTS